MADDFEVVDTESNTVDTKKTTNEVDALRDALINRANKQLQDLPRRRWKDELDDRGKKIVDELKSNLSDEEYFNLVETEAKKAVVEELKEENRRFFQMLWDLLIIIGSIYIIAGLIAICPVTKETTQRDCQHLDFSWNSTHFQYKYDVKVQRKQDPLESWLLGRDYKIEIYGAKKTRLAVDEILYQYENTLTELGAFTISKFNVTELYDYHSKVANLLGYKKHFVDIEYTVKCEKLEAERQKWLLARMAAAVESQMKTEAGSFTDLGNKKTIAGMDFGSLFDISML